MGELQLKQIAIDGPALPMSFKAAILFSSCKSYNKSGSADDLLGAETTEDMRRRCLGMSQSTSLEQLAVYDQNARKLSFQVRKRPYVTCVILRIVILVFHIIIFLIII